MPLQITGDADTRDAPDVRGDFLNNHHERKAQNESPGEPIAELGADLAVGANSARIIVGGACDETGAERSDERSRTAFSCFTLLRGRHERTLTAKPCQSNCS